MNYKKMYTCDLFSHNIYQVHTFKHIQMTILINFGWIWLNLISGSIKKIT